MRVADGARALRYENDFPGLISRWGETRAELLALIARRNRIEAGALQTYGRIIDETDVDLEEGREIAEIDHALQRCEAILDEVAAALVGSRAPSVEGAITKLEIALQIMPPASDARDRWNALVESCRDDLLAIAPAGR